MFPAAQITRHAAAFWVQTHCENELKKQQSGQKELDPPNDARLSRTTPRLHALTNCVTSSGSFDKILT